MRRMLARTNPARLTRLVARASLVLVLTSAAWTVGAPPTTAAPAGAVIRAAHFSPTTPGVDVYLTPFSGGPTTKAWLSNVSYGTVSSYQTLTPGLYTVAMRLAGADPGTPPALTWVLDARPGSAYTVAGVGSGSALRGVVIPDDLSSPPAGHGLVRVIQAASRAPVASVTAAAGSVIAGAAQFATVSPYAAVTAGPLDVTATSTTDPGLTAEETVDVRSGQITTLLLLDAQSSGITMRALLDSAAAATAPVGAVPAGAGGTAGRPAGLAASPWPLAPLPTVLTFLTVLAGIAALTVPAVVGRGRRPVRTAPTGRHQERLHGRHAAG